MIVNSLASEVVDAQVSLPRDIIFADPIVMAAHATPAISRVEPDLANELASAKEV